MHAGKLEQDTNFTIVGGNAKHCVNRYMVLFRYCSLGTTLLCRAGYMLGFAAHFQYHMPHTFLGLESSSPERREDAVCPVVGGDVEPAEHLRRGDRLRVHPHLLVRRAAVGHGLHQQVDDARLPGARRTEHHHAVTHSLSLVQLHTHTCLLYTSPSPRDRTRSRMPSSA